MTHRAARFAAIAALVGASLAPFAQAQSVPMGDKLYANAVASFQQGRFPEAYGRFIALADAGHTPAAEMALFMAQNSAAVFSKDWDVSQEQLAAWAALTGRPAPVLQARSYPRTVVPAKHAAR